MKKVLVTGINGFTGKHFQKYVFKSRLNEKFAFYGVDKNITDKSENLIKFVEADLSTGSVEKFQKVRGVGEYWPIVEGGAGSFPIDNYLFFINAKKST